MIYSLFLVFALHCAFSHQVYFDRSTFRLEPNEFSFFGTEKWVTFQRRVSDSVDFYRSFREYEDGFGNIEENFWLGLREIHKYTKNGCKLLVVMEGWDGTIKWAKYDHFEVEGSENKYKLHVCGYSGTAGDSMRYHNGMFFSSKDQDNDKSNKHCAQVWFGGWWYNDCLQSNPNGKYNGEKKELGTGIVWLWFDDSFYTSLKSFVMMLAV